MVPFLFATFPGIRLGPGLRICEFIYFLVICVGFVAFSAFALALASAFSFALAFAFTSYFRFWFSRLLFLLPRFTFPGAYVCFVCLGFLEVSSGNVALALHLR